MKTTTRAHPQLPHAILAMVVAFAATACDPEETTSDDVRAAELEPPIEGLEPVGFDEDRQIALYDRDGDSFPDITEQLAGTDLSDPDSNPWAEHVGDFVALAGPGEGGFPAADCRKGFVQAGPRLCIDKSSRNPKTYRKATAVCRDMLSHVCSVEDLDYLYLNTKLDEDYNPKPGNKEKQRHWIGNYVGDDTALCGDRSITSNNDPDIEDFDGECSAQERHRYWCCHDDDKGKKGEKGDDDEDEDEDDNDK